VALKLSYISPSNNTHEISEYMKHVQRECKTQRVLNHPNINRLIDVVDMDEDTVACIIELCEGTDLSTYLKANGCLEEKEARLIIKQIIDALFYLDRLPTKVIHYFSRHRHLLVFAALNIRV
jgi:tousled-like kinase